MTYVSSGPKSSRTESVYQMEVFSPNGQQDQEFHYPTDSMLMPPLEPIENGVAVEPQSILDEYTDQQDLVNEEHRVEIIESNVIKENLQEIKLELDMTDMVPSSRVPTNSELEKELLAIEQELKMLNQNNSTSSQDTFNIEDLKLFDVHDIGSGSLLQEMDFMLDEIELALGSNSSSNKNNNGSEKGGKTSSDRSELMSKLEQENELLRQELMMLKKAKEM